MAVALYESVDSRRFTQDRNGGGFTAKFFATGSTDEQAIRAAVVFDTPVSYWNTLWRSAIRINPKGGGPHWDVEVDYSSIPPGEAIQAPGFNAGNAPNPVAPDPALPLGPGFAASTGGGTTKIYQSLGTRSITRSLAAIAAPRVARDFHGAINVTDEAGAEGVDIVSRQGEWSIDVRRPVVTLAYFTNLFLLTGTVNQQPFYGFARGEVLYLGAELRYTAPEWSVTHKFAVSPNELNKVISKDEAGVAQITVAEKRGWDYVWVTYFPKVDGAKRIIPEAAYVEQVYEERNFAFLEIGG